ncbi:MAG: 1-acyl-sn-glycerol-3-phosphate acyltransferase [Actinomycetota bacterium]
MGRRAQRLLAIITVLVALPTIILFFPILLAGAVVVDAGGRLFRFPSVRLLLFAIVYLVHSWVGLGRAASLRLHELTGRFRHDGEGQAEHYRRIQAWWASSLLTWARRLLNVRFDLGDTSVLPAHGFILISRHASMVDALLPAEIVASGLGRFVHYVLKHELQWDPNLNIYGHRLGNYFVRRDGDGDAEADAIARFADRSRPGSALVIFPEGTYATPTRQRQIRDSLARKGLTDLVALADELDHLLPPKPAGTLALLASQPRLDVVVVGHVGLEGVTDAGLRRLLPLRHPVVVRWWVHARASVPAGGDEQIAWLNDQWRTLDRWVGSVAAERTT